jgi:hypothetical protein
LNRTNNIAFNPNQQISGFAFLGLDEIADDLTPIANDGYLDPFSSVPITNIHFEVNELNMKVHTADPVGWASGIELVACELHWRLDKMLGYCAKHAPTIKVRTEEQRRFLANARYNTVIPATAQSLANNLSANVVPWSGPYPPDNMNAKYNAILTVAVAEWYEAARVYR